MGKGRRFRFSPQEKRSLLQSRGLDPVDMDNFQRDYARIHTPGMAVKQPKSGTVYVVDKHGSWRKVKNNVLKDYIDKKIMAEDGIRAARGTDSLRVL